MTTREELEALMNGPMMGRVRDKTRVRVGKSTPTQPNGHFARPGTGPEGETCKTCAHRVRNELRSGRVFQKCGKARERWTGGRGSDIRVTDAACVGWETET